jgi:NAD(P)-dependent dehydrogenase (short-subunit alcohol dehydrogenase family)
MNKEDLFSLKGKVAIVTGACGLLGKQHCIALANAGASVVVCDVNSSAIDEFVMQLGDKHLGITLDVTNKSSILEANEKILSAYHRIDILVNNAAINDMFENPSLAAEQSMFENYPLTSWEASWKVNVTGVFLCAQVFGTAMVNQGNGSIINIASTYGVVAPDQSIYQNENGEQQS